MTTRIYIGNLSDEVTAEDLERLCAPLGKVQNAEVFTDLTGRGGGFAFVEMKSSDAARRAIDELNGQQFAGRMLSVKETNEEEEQVGPVPGGFGDRGGFGGGDYN